MQCRKKGMLRRRPLLDAGGEYRRRIRQRKTGFPSFPTMQSISRLLDVQIGYLIGESKGRTFDEQEVSEYLGISVEAVNALRELAARPGANSSPFKEKIRFANDLLCRHPRKSPDEQ